MEVLFCYFNQVAFVVSVVVVESNTSALKQIRVHGSNQLYSWEFKILRVYLYVCDLQRKAARAQVNIHYVRIVA